MSKRARKTKHETKPAAEQPSEAMSDAKASVGQLPPEVLLHLKVGWWSLLVFLSLGIGLEVLHGFKVDLYLNVNNETRRMMWTLAHAHGVLLSLVHVVFAATLPLVPHWTESTRRLASRSLIAAILLMPLGFFLGGLFFYSGDPGLGIFLVPIGGVALFVGVLLTARGIRPRA